MAFFLQMNKVIYVTLRILPWWWNGRHAGLKILWEHYSYGYIKTPILMSNWNDFKIHSEYTSYNRARG